MDASDAKLAMRRIGKRFGGVTALENVDFDIRRGEVHAICGENGAGKSTLMKVLSGIIVDYEGELVVDGNRVHFNGPRDAERHGISIIHQELNLVPELTAAANIFLGREKTRLGFLLDDRTMRREAAAAFQLLGASFSPNDRIRDLRIGDRQLVEIAKALSLRSSVLIMDEPTSALAEGEVANLFRAIGDLKARGASIIYISHKMDEVFHLADRITVLRDGKRVASFDRASASPGQVVSAMVGREIATLKLPSAAAASRVVLQVESLSLPNNDVPDAMRLADISFDLRAGEILGVAGLLGAGRTELLESLFGVAGNRPQGQIRLEGEIVNIDSPREAVRLGLALVTEDRKTLGLFEQFDVGRNIGICTLAAMSTAGFLSRRRELATSRRAIARLGIKTDGPAAPILSLSGGNQQKCILARWLETKPRVLLLDEPTRGIDVGAKAEIYRLLRQLCEEGIAILMTSSELPELLQVCDRILVLCEGRASAIFDRGDATEEKIVEAAMRFRSKLAS